MILSAPARILVVDDNRANRIVLERLLSQEGFEVVSAAGGAEALTTLQATLGKDLRAEPIDLVVLDIMMPDVDGLEVLRRVRKSTSSVDLPIVMATAKDQTEDIVDALKAGANDYVVKPINFPVLLARIETQLELKAARQDLKTAHDSLLHNAKSESVGLLAAGVAHEIRNPLARIHLGLESIQRHQLVKADEKLAKSVQATADACDRADEVVGDLMKLAAESRPNVQDLDIRTVIDEALHVMVEMIDSQHVDLRIESDPSLPQARYALPELRQILVSLFLNALQAMPDSGDLVVRTALRKIDALPDEKGGRSGNVLRRGDEMIAIDIEDSGPGFPDDKMLTAFDAFYTTKAAGSANGLGLTLAKRMLDLQGGRISLGNHEGGGARVTVLLPKAGGFFTSV